MSTAGAVVVADAGPLIVLGVVSLLTPAAEMLGPMAVPQAVLDECLARPDAPGARQIAAALQTGSLCATATAEIALLDPAQAHGLGAGEMAVIAYAHRHGLTALVDDRKARATAIRLGVSLLGSGAVLIGLKRAGKLATVGAVLQLWRAHGYFVSDKARAELRTMAGE